MNGSRSDKHSKLANFLFMGPLPIKDMCDIICEYGQGLEGRRRLTLRNFVNMNALAELPDGKLATCCSNGVVYRWDTVSGAPVRKTISANGLPVSSLAVLQDGGLVTGAWDNMVRVWRNGSHIQRLEGHASNVEALAALPHGKLASGSWDCTVRIWDVANSTCLLTLLGHTNIVSALAVLPEGKLASGSWGCDDVRVWDTETGACLRTLEGRTMLGVNCLAALPDGQLASGSNDKTVRIWDVLTGVCKLTLKGHASDVNALAALPDGKLASGSADETVRVWDVKSGACLLTITEGSPVNSLVVLSSSELAVGTPNRVSIYE